MGAVFGVRPGSTAGGVVDLQVAGVWSDEREGGFPSLPTPRSDGSRLHSRSASGASPRRKQDKKSLRSSAKR